MASTVQEQFFSSLRHKLLDLARRLQKDTVNDDVADYVLFIFILIENPLHAIG